MVKKDYIKIAKIFNDMFPVKSDIEDIQCFQTRLYQYKRLVDRFTKVLKEDNKNFDSLEFAKAIQLR